MNQEWKDFLINNSANFNNNGNIEFSIDFDSRNFFCPISHLGILAVSGKDAAKFLQGQATCNIIEDINDNKSSLGAFCTPKGRAISTFLVAKNQASYYLILPSVLLATVKKRLQMYVLRSDVTLTDSTNELCLIGLSIEETTQTKDDLPQLPFAVSQHENLTIRYPSQTNRYLIIEKTEQAKQLWSKFVEKNSFTPIGTSQWQKLDIVDGIPWLNEQTSEEFIPQMFNLDQLDGISFKKGCYTGQEIIARTYYLGKAKRKMYLAECQKTGLSLTDLSIYDASSDAKSVGKILTWQCNKDLCVMQVIIQSEIAESKQLYLGNSTEINLKQLKYPYF